MSFLRINTNIATVLWMNQKDQNQSFITLMMAVVTAETCQFSNLKVPSNFVKLVITTLKTERNSEAGGKIVSRDIEKFPFLFSTQATTHLCSGQLFNHCKCGDRPSN